MYMPCLLNFMLIHKLKIKEQFLYWFSVFLRHDSVFKWVSDCCIAQTMSTCQLYHGEKELHTMSPLCTRLLDQHPLLDFYCAGSLKQQCAGIHVPQLGHILLIQVQQVFVLSLLCCMLSREAAANTNVIVFGLTRSGLKHTIYRTLTITQTMRF